MVPDATGDVDRTTHSPPLVQGHASRPRGTTTPTSNPEAAKTGRLEDIWQQHASTGVSKQTSELLIAGWSKGTNTAYESGWKRWTGWCEGRKINPISAGVQPFLDFLTFLFQEGLQYRSINTIRSAVSSTHQSIEGIPIGQHPLVKQLLRGVYNSRPPQPRCTHIWDVNLVLEHLE